MSTIMFCKEHKVNRQSENKVQRTSLQFLKNKKNKWEIIDLNSYLTVLNTNSMDKRIL